MKIRIKWLGQARAAADRDRDVFECANAPTIADVLSALVVTHGSTLQRLLLNEHGAPHSSVMLFVNDEQVVSGSATVLNDGDELTVMPPISGG